MTTWRLYGYSISLLVLLLTKVRAIIDMRSQGQMHIVDPGDAIKLTCEFEAVKFDMFQTPPIWKKSQLTETQIMNIMSQLQSPYSGTKRFEVTHRNNEISSCHSFDLEIKDIQSGDSGNYTCQILGPESTILAQVTHYIMVRSPVDQLYIANATRYDISTLNFTEGDKNSLECTSTGGYPPPLMRLYLACNHREYVRKEITSQLRWDQMPKLGGQKGLRDITYYSIQWSHDFEVKPYYDRCEITCAVNLPGLQEPPYDSRSVSAILNVLYAPIIKCPNKTALPGDKNPFLACEVDAKPPALSTRWVLDSSGTEIIDARRDGDKWVVRVEESNQSGPFRSRLYFRVATNDTFRTYTFIAENLVGISSNAVTLAHKMIPSPPPPMVYEVATPIAGPRIGNSASRTLPITVTSQTMFILAIVMFIQRLWLSSAL